MGIKGIHHINLIVPQGTLYAAREFYGNTLGLTPRDVPAAQRGTLAWFDIAESGQQVHIAFGREEDFSEGGRGAGRHPCFKLGGLDELKELQEKIWAHFLRGKEEGKRDVVLGTPMTCDEPGKGNSGAQGPEYPTRFFARDYAGNRLEFTL
ncbi:hypothetical protein QBC38DRAFT_102001 [Podospora fimiseda]|uniref:VOC domain-containing protein n=1 Tax=Podospora fimiseda TaxID=252190 RepID=A0AAN6YQJ8_9PEZI|nr:hypothetical protein QBC38DRAFT_102001 [Podospora fimiseda]